ncbi:PREDICTED: probable inactive protein kinase DDB_G0270444 isoform X3 [Drosophila arizonae]|uniref:Transcription initiation factor TFIID subunit 8 n=1 Tax=Drosophila arizonae TaxID=7263 RepID=A0ABM1P6K7_DROAR|nr:PREDICTED: probable inactive protein kinase DDB_G0270444 isoform X3 [Drosophila arizonae]
MHPYDEVLRQIVEQMLIQKECQADNQHVLDNLVILMRNRVRDIAKITTSAASHAGRSMSCYFDVERTFRMLGIGVSGLREIRDADPETQPPGVTLPPTEIRDEDFHQSPQQDINQQRGTRSGRHIPKHLPPFPGLHTYKNTMMGIVTDRGYIMERERSAQLQRNAQRALNSFFQRTLPTTSLFSGRHPKRKHTEFLLLTAEPSTTPAYLSALMPKNEVYDTDIYKSNNEINPMAHTNPFLQKPKGLPSESSDEEESVRVIESEIESESCEERGAGYDSDVEYEGDEENEENEYEATAEYEDEASEENEIEASAEYKDEASKKKTDEASAEKKDEVAEENKDEVAEENKDEAAEENKDKATAGYENKASEEKEDETFEECEEEYSEENETGNANIEGIETESSRVNEIKTCKQSIVKNIAETETEYGEENQTYTQSEDECGGNEYEYEYEYEYEEENRDENKCEYSKEIESESSGENEIKTCGQSKIDDNEEIESESSESKDKNNEKTENESSGEDEVETCKQMNDENGNEIKKTINVDKDDDVTDSLNEMEDMADFDENMILCENDDENVDFFDGNHDVDWELLDLYQD